MKPRICAFVQSLLKHAIRKMIIIVRKTIALAGVAQLIRASSQYARVVGSISSQGTYEKQPMNA